MKFLTQEEIKKMLIFSYKRVEREKENINKINVFPVPDQDTGSNLAATLKGIKEKIENKDFKNVEELCSAALDGALESAQGNAGVIYTGFLAGFLPVLNKNPVDTKKFSQAFEAGAKRAKQAIQNPKEGTILDVINAATLVFKENSQTEQEFTNLFEMAIEKANEALLATREKMEIFKKANVVDAGGFGFLIILESYLEALKPESAKKEKEKMKKSEQVKKFVQILSNRYEVVALIESPEMEEKEIREKLTRWGNCLDIVQAQNKMKIHIHTDYPEEVKKILINLGEVRTLKEQDMAREVVGEESIRKVSIGIVTDEIADLTKKITERYQIEVVPYKLNWPEGEGLPGENIYQKMREAEKLGITKLPKTSQASPKDFLNAYNKQFEKGFEKIICLPLSSKLSGGYNSAIQAKELLPDDKKNKVYIFDTLQATCGQALLVLKTIELIQSQIDAKEIIENLKEEIKKIHLYGFLKDPKWLEWGGRASHSQANWVRRLQKIGIRPLVGIKEGKVEQIGFRFGAKDISDAVFKEIESKSRKVREKGKKIRVVITHCDNLEDATKLKQLLKGIKAETSFINLTGSIVGVHVGPGSLIAAWTEF